MSDVSSGARSPNEPGYPAAGTYVAPAEAYGTSGSAEESPVDDGGDSTAKQVASQTTQAAGQAAGDVAGTAKDQARKVAGETRDQVRNVASDVRDRVGEQARTQNDKLVSTIRDTAAQLDEMRGDRADSPAATVVSRVADGGRQIADYLETNGPEGVLREVQDFARRRPGAFLATALAAGFVVGRLGKGVAKADPSPESGTESAPDTGKPVTDSFESVPVPVPAGGYAPSGVYASTADYTATGAYPSGTR